MVRSFSVFRSRRIAGSYRFFSRCRSAESVIHNDIAWQQLLVWLLKYVSTNYILAFSWRVLNRKMNILYVFENHDKNDLHVNRILYIYPIILAVNPEASDCYKKKRTVHFLRYTDLSRKITLYILQLMSLNGIHAASVSLWLSRYRTDRCVFLLKWFENECFMQRFGLSVLYRFPNYIDLS